LAFTRSRTWIHLVQSRLRLLANYPSDVVAGLVRIVTALLPRVVSVAGREFEIRAPASITLAAKPD
jgi:hypothetical protein